MAKKVTQRTRRELIEARQHRTERDRSPVSARRAWAPDPGPRYERTKPRSP